MTVAPVGALMLSLACATVTVSPTLAFPPPVTPLGPVMVIEPPVAVEPDPVTVSVYVPSIEVVGIWRPLRLSIVGSTAFATDNSVPVCEYPRLASSCRSWSR